MGSGEKWYKKKNKANVTLVLYLDTPNRKS